MQKFKRYSFLFLAILIVAAIVHFYNKAADGFSLRQIQSSLKNNPSNELAAPTDYTREDLRKILSQPFYYIGKGAQCYAFASEDGKYVIKFFKHKHLRPLTWLNYLPIPSAFQPFCTKKIEKREKRIRDLFASYKLAFEEMRDETGLIYVHLNRRPDLLKSVQIVDKLGMKHTILVDHYEYILQKRAVQVLDALPRGAFSEDEFRSKLHQLCQVILQRCEKGIKDRDPAVLRNMAFCLAEPRAVYIDTGAFCKDSSMTSEKVARKDVVLRLKELRIWAKNNNPQLIQVIDSVVQEYDDDACLANNT